MYFHLGKAIAKSFCGTKMVVIFRDLNKFKKIDDIFGRLEGDRIIKEFSGKIKRTFREEEMLFRPQTSRFGDVQIKRKRKSRIYKVNFRFYLA